MTVPLLAESTILVRIPLQGEAQDALIAFLAETGAHAFEQTTEEVLAYYQADNYDAAAVQEILAAHWPGLTPTVEHIAPKDWNAEWERNWEPVLVDDLVEVHLPFHRPTPGIQHHLAIMPRMAFGTGHHATTWLMLRQITRLAPAGKTVLDMGCGTAVLGILAAKLGASHVTAIDIDPWGYENALENAALNGADAVQVIIGDASAIPAQCYDIVLANINRNVLLADRDAYLAHLTPGGDLILSGIMDIDEEMVAQHYQAAGLRLVARDARKEWVMLAFKQEGKEGE